MPANLPPAYFETEKRLREARTPAEKIEVLEEILEGANSKAKEAGISIIGGHTVDDTEPKYGLAVTGIIENNKILKNSNAKQGDVLILTKWQLNLFAIISALFSLLHAIVR